MRRASAIWPRIAAESACLIAVAVSWIKWVVSVDMLSAFSNLPPECQKGRCGTEQREKGRQVMPAAPGYSTGSTYSPRSGAGAGGGGGGGGTGQVAVARITDPSGQVCTSLAARPAAAAAVVPSPEEAAAEQDGVAECHGCTQRRCTGQARHTSQRKHCCCKYRPRSLALLVT